MYVCMILLTRTRFSVEKLVEGIKANPHLHGRVLPEALLGQTAMTDVRQNCTLENFRSGRCSYCFSVLLSNDQHLDLLEPKFIIINSVVGFYCYFSLGPLPNCCLWYHCLWPMSYLWGRWSEVYWQGWPRPTTESGEHCKLPNWFWGKAPAASDFGAFCQILRMKECCWWHLSCTAFPYSFFLILFCTCIKTDWTNMWSSSGGGCHTQEEEEEIILLAKRVSRCLTFHSDTIGGTWTQ